MTAGTSTGNTSGVTTGDTTGDTTGTVTDGTTARSFYLTNSNTAPTSGGTCMMDLACDSACGDGAPGANTGT